MRIDEQPRLTHTLGKGKEHDNIQSHHRYSAMLVLGSYVCSRADSAESGAATMEG